MQNKITDPRKHVRIEYRVRADVELEDLRREIAEFVAGIRGHSAEHLYTSYQDVNDPRHFVHVGSFRADGLPSLQAEGFFRRFTAILRERCEVGPEVTTLAQVASTR